MVLKEAVDLFHALSDETRLRLLKLLIDSDTEPCVCELEDALELPQYSVSKHLNMLKRVGLLESRREGTWVYYYLFRDLEPGIKNILKSIGKVLDDKTFQKDKKRLRKRIALREEGKCVVGHQN